MRVPLDWLSDYVDIDDTPQELAHRLTMAGLEVETIETVGADCPGVVAGKVEAREPHPNADKLSVCRVTTGDAVHDVVCGAPNVEAGGVYPFAPIGSVLPGNFKIKKAKLRGVVSMGMLCSAKELQIAEDADGLMELPPGTVPGTALADILGPPETVLELGITPNRPDCLGMIGIAREVSALTGKPLKLPSPSEVTEEGNLSDHLSLRLECPDGCPRYTGRLVRGVKIGPSPMWLQKYLTAAGSRPLNNVVDITNFVMLETGHPMHAFDARDVTGNKIVIRWAGQDEKLEVIDGTELDLCDQDVVIADAERGVALGGIMGGANSEIRDDTTDVILEVAHFDPVVIRKSARRLRLHTDASHRFERGCDPAATADVINRAASLLADLAEGTPVAGVADAYPQEILPREIRLRPRFVNGLLGTDLPAQKMARILTSLGMEVEADSDDGPEPAMRVRVPTFRPDIETETDLSEEVARLHGYDEIESSPPRIPALPTEESPLLKLIHDVRDSFASSGLCETISLSFTPPGADESVTLKKPLTEDSAALRQNLIDGLLATMQFNLQRQSPPPRLFEIGRVFRQSREGEKRTRYGFDKLPVQPYQAAFLVSGRSGPDWRDEGRNVDFHTARGVLDALAAQLKIPLEIGKEIPEDLSLPSAAHPVRRAAIRSGGKCVGFVAEISPDVAFLKKFPLAAAFAQIDLEALASRPRRAVKLAPLPGYPKAERDLAFLLPEQVSFEQVRQAIDTAGAANLESVELFDVFTGKSLPEGKKSVAFNLAFRHPDRTLKDDEVEAAVGSIVNRVKELGGELR